jgi:hypothetical protein
MKLFLLFRRIEMKKLTVIEAVEYMVKANDSVVEFDATNMAKGSYRYGQALWNSLPEEIRDTHISTDADFFYDEDQPTVNGKFFTFMVEGVDHNK